MGSESLFVPFLELFPFVRGACSLFVVSLSPAFVVSLSFSVRGELVFLRSRRACLSPFVVSLSNHAFLRKKHAFDEPRPNGPGSHPWDETPSPGSSSSAATALLCLVTYIITRVYCITQKYFAENSFPTREFCEQCRFVFWELLKGQGRLDSPSGRIGRPCRDAQNSNATQGWVTVR